MTSPYKDRSQALHSMPHRIVIDFLEGTTRKRDAEIFARGFIENHFDSPESSGYFVMPYPGGYAFEAQEGGEGRAWLPAIMASLDSDPTAVVVIQMSRRVLEVRKTENDSYSAILLPEGMDSTAENQVNVEPTSPLKPYQRSGLGIFLVGVSTFTVSSFFFLIAALIYFFGTGGSKISPPTTLPTNLPTSQWAELQKRKSENTYVRLLRFDNGKWEIAVAQIQPQQPQPPVMPSADPGIPPSMQNQPGLQPPQSGQPDVPVIPPPAQNEPSPLPMPQAMPMPAPQQDEAAPPAMAPAPVQSPNLPPTEAPPPADETSPQNQPPTAAPALPF